MNKKLIVLSLLIGVLVFSLTEEEYIDISRQVPKTITKQVIKKKVVKSNFPPVKEIAPSIQSYENLTHLSLEDIKIRVSGIEDEIESSRLIKMANKNGLNQEDEIRLKSLFKQYDRLQIELIERQLKNI